MIKAIIIDWGRTLWDNEKGVLFPGTREIIEYLKTKGYRLAVLSISPPERIDDKKKTIDASGIKKYFEKVVVSTKKEKEDIDEIVKTLGLDYGEVMVIGDRIVREVKIANQLGMKSVWLKQGKFSEELPNEETGNPTYTIFSLQELKSIL